MKTDNLYGVYVHGQLMALFEKKEDAAFYIEYYVSTDDAWIDEPTAEEIESIGF